ncbi:hypothetical protein [Bradyrhizobium japonicum]|jgi:hypothetical protein|uniref:hypothetical protein n=1 Tax=Bradyrhizobium japonicum TaxID=375 RepID=UPI0020A1FF6E|nr:hypothetical protein [Bradyrhizobium japonicum]MCP1765031.1 hypothetical protein [Bradyrhizobium japonicum]MCP1787168.1 hypothetical protein [Bradyrhizobium japonicum]MCP1809045.1 hypothetical protein [Bradyrhizobium japonicum]MCP1817975.1 hypothetical protein [Bradyrhizobium japonicum]MCP1870513.1 hypothetical protein [Bradyrhizobium japonicum]
MEAKHTPGPWTVHHSMRDCVTFEGRHGTENLFLENLDGYYACQSEADARLIAAAPDLVEALQEYDDAFTEFNAEDKDSRTRMRQAVIKARTAIAKAKGGTA